MSDAITRAEKPASRGGRAATAAASAWLRAGSVFQGAGNQPAPVLPARSIAGRALVLVIVIMTFLAGLAAGAVHLVADASSDWSRDIAREITIQIRPLPGRDIEADVRIAADIARRMREVEDVRVFDRKEGEKLLEPWLGTGLDLSELPVPRLVVMRIAPGTPNLASLKAQLAERVPNAGLDDHRLWLSRLKAMADTLVVIGLVILGLVLVATGLAVVFATRGAMAGTAHVIDVLHLVGAEDQFIARQFQRHFMRLGLKGGLAGGVIAMLFFLAMGLSSARFAMTPGAEQVEALFGRFSLPLGGYISVLAIGVLVAVLTAFVSRVTVYRTLSGGE
ncbi:MAG: ABC transporter permease [Proteobacteria bacterium]|nr:ABC transporter permease [Pseudomonadota bacterium]